MSTSQTHEQITLNKRGNFSVEELKRLYYDLVGLKDISVQEIHQLREESKHINANLDNYYYMERMELIEDYYTRLAKFQKHMEKKGLTQKPGDKLHKILNLDRFNLENGALYLHWHAFIPAIELLASDEQAKKWLPLCRDLKITGSYV
jgi:hypothetical protein